MRNSAVRLFPVAENLPCNAGDVSSIPGQGTKTPQAKKQLSLHVPITESHAVTRESMCLSERSDMTERVATKTQDSLIN